jgi:hypothetical protein
MTTPNNDDYANVTQLGERFGLSLPTIRKLVSGLEPIIQGTQKLYPVKAVTDRINHKDTTPPSHTLAKARLTTAQAERAELKLGLERGELVRVADVTTVMSNAFITLRTQLLSTPNKLAARLENVTKEQAAKLLTVEIERLLYDLANNTDSLYPENQGSDQEEPATAPAPDSLGMGRQVQEATTGDLSGTGTVADLTDSLPSGYPEQP